MTLRIISLFATKTIGSARNRRQNRSDGDRLFDRGPTVAGRQRRNCWNWTALRLPDVFAGFLFDTELRWNAEMVRL
jgi:hypothetical protein